jgi:hypothetical protein
MTEMKDGARSGAARSNAAANATAAEENAPRKPLTPAAQRALAEAAARRAEREGAEAKPPQEIAGRGGLDPARYGDWEVKGVASDF